MNWSEIKQKFLNRNFFISLIIITLVVILMLLSLLGEKILNSFSKDQLTITASLSKMKIISLSKMKGKITPTTKISDSLLYMQGRVLQETTGESENDSRVWVTLIGEGGQEYSPPSTNTNLDGEFTFDSLPNFVGLPSTQSLGQSKKVGETSKSLSASNSVKEAIISAYSDSNKISGNKNILLEGSGLNPISVTPWQMFFILILFVTSIILPFLPLSHRFIYNWSIILAFLFSIAMIALIWFGLRLLSGFVQDDVFQVGIGSIYKGAYDMGTAKDWLFSLTSPTEDLKTLGFGVPLWVVLLSVIGSSLYTLSIIISEILNRPDFTKFEKDSPKDEIAIKEFRGKIENIVRHQFYMLFSPIGAIFIYQLLVMLKAADHPFTVALAALGSGLILNLLLDQAVTFTKGKLEKAKDTAPEIKTVRT